MFSIGVIIIIIACILVVCVIVILVGFLLINKNIMLNLVKGNIESEKNMNKEVIISTSKTEISCNTN